MFKERLSRVQSHACMDYAEAMMVFEAKPQRARCPVGAVGIVGAVGAVPTRGGSGPRTKSGTQRAVRVNKSVALTLSEQSSIPVRQGLFPLPVRPQNLSGTSRRAVRSVLYIEGDSPLYIPSMCKTCQTERQFMPY